MKKQNPLNAANLTVTTTEPREAKKATRKPAAKEPVKLQVINQRFMAVMEYSIQEGIFKNEFEALTKIKLLET